MLKMTSNINKNYESQPEPIQSIKNFCQKPTADKEAFQSSMAIKNESL